MGIDLFLMRTARAALVAGWLVAGACAPAAGPGAAATSPAAPTGTPAAAPDKVVLAVNGRPDQAAMQLAIDRGYFAEQGIAIETVQLDGSAQLTPAMATTSAAARSAPRPGTPRHARRLRLQEVRRRHPDRAAGDPGGAAAAGHRPASRRPAAAGAPPGPAPLCAGLRLPPPEVATRFMVAYLRGVRDYHDAFFGTHNLDATIADLSRSLPLKDPATWRAAHPTSVDLNGEIDVASLDQQARFYQEHGLLGDAPDIARFVDTRFAQAAVQQLGRR